MLGDFWPWRVDSKYPIHNGAPDVQSFHTPVLEVLIPLIAARTWRKTVAALGHARLGVQSDSMVALGAAIDQSTAGCRIKESTAQRFTRCGATRMSWKVDIATGNALADATARLTSFATAAEA